SFLWPGAKSEADESEPEAPSLAPDDAPERSAEPPPDFKPDELDPDELGPDELGTEFDIPAPPPVLSPAPCANATGAPSSNAAIATEYFNICFSYAEYHFPV